jgi:hypothetical protein
LNNECNRIFYKLLSKVDELEVYGYAMTSFSFWVHILNGNTTLLMRVIAALVTFSQGTAAWSARKLAFHKNTLRMASNLPADEKGPQARAMFSCPSGSIELGPTIHINSMRQVG